MNKYNVYNLNWKWIGTFWSGGNYFNHNQDGDFIRTIYSGKILTRDKQEYKEIEPMICYIKFMGKDGSIIKLDSDNEINKLVG